MSSAIFSRTSRLLVQSARGVLRSIAITLVCVGCEITAPRGFFDLAIDSRSVVLAPGDTMTIGLTLSYDHTPTYRTVEPNILPWPAAEPIEWSSSDATVATVAANGRITALKAGRTLLSARAE